MLAFYSSTFLEPHWSGMGPSWDARMVFRKKPEGVPQAQEGPLLEALVRCRSHIRTAMLRVPREGIPDRALSDVVVAIDALAVRVTRHSLSAGVQKRWD